VLITTTPDLHQLITSHFNPTQIKVNGSVTSFGFIASQTNSDVQSESDPINNIAYSNNDSNSSNITTSIGLKIFQIDFIETQPSLFEMYRFYLSYGDLGQILGR